MITREKAFAKELETIAVQEAPVGLIMQVIPQWIQALNAHEAAMRVRLARDHVEDELSAHLVSNPLQAKLFERIRVRAEEFRNEVREELRAARQGGS